MNIIELGAIGELVGGFDQVYGRLGSIHFGGGNSS